MPQHDPGEAVHVVDEIRDQTGLADPGRPADRDEPRDPAVDRDVEQVLEKPRFRVPAEHRGLEAGRAPRAGPAGDHPAGAVEVKRLRLALDAMLAGVLVSDAGGGDLHRHVVDEDGSRSRRRLNPRSGVDAVADHEPLIGIGQGSDLPGHHPGSRLQARGSDVGTERCDRVDQSEPGPDGSLRIVLTGLRDSPDRHHGVADELLDRSPMATHDRLRQAEVAVEELANILGVARLRKSREPGQIDEQDGDVPERGGRVGRCRSGSSGGPAVRATSLRSEPLAAAVAEGLLGAVWRPATRTGEDELGAAASAEPRLHPVLRTASGTNQVAPFSRTDNHRTRPRKPCPKHRSVG